MRNCRRILLPMVASVICWLASTTTTIHAFSPNVKYVTTTAPLRSTQQQLSSTVKRPSTSRNNCRLHMIMLDSSLTNGAMNSHVDLMQTNFVVSDISNLLLASSSSNVDSNNSFLFNSDVWVFVAGIFPFAWATIEFWRRIAVGEPFGTGSDSVIIGQDNAPESSRGRRVLGQDALITAYILFTIAAAVIGLTVYTVISSPSADFVSNSFASVGSIGDVVNIQQIGPL